jgi:hypothetical protein
VWDLRTPEGEILRARADGRFVVVDADALFVEHADAEVPLAPVRPDDGVSAAEPVAFVTEPAIRRLLFSAVRELGWQVYQAASTREGAPDFIVRTPDTTTFVEVKFARAGGDARLHLALVQPGHEAPLLATRSIERVIPVRSQAQLSELADAA